MSWCRGQAYAQDLRDRVLAAIDRGMGAYQAAPLFQVSVSWIDKALARRRDTGESTARPQVNHVPPKLLAQHEAIRLKLKAEPDLTLTELRAWLREAHQVSISQRGMWKTLRQLDLTRKKDPARLGAEPSRRCCGATGLVRQSAEAEPHQAGLH
jgi:transposase